MDSWIKCLRLPDDDDDLALLLARHVEPLNGLEALDSEHACQLISDRLGGLHVPTLQELPIVRGVVGLGAYHAGTYYCSEAKYRRLRETRDPYASEPTLRAFTAESGVGKSDIMEAIYLLLSRAEPIDLGGDVGRVAIKCCAYIRLRRNIKLFDVMNMIAASIGAEEQFTEVTRQGVLVLRQQLYRLGTCLLLVDELQFETLSSTAHTTLAKLIYFLEGFGIPVVYALNYSAARLLSDYRPEQDLQRFFKAPTILIPELPDEDSFITQQSEI